MVLDTTAVAAVIKTAVIVSGPPTIAETLTDIIIRTTNKMSTVDHHPGPQNNNNIPSSTFLPSANNAVAQRGGTTSSIRDSRKLLSYPGTVLTAP